ncbi:hypothetical protein INT48_003057, partial [Thamnidium elegans]
VSDFTSGDRHFAALGVQHKEQTLDILHETSDVCCCFVNVDISTEEVDIKEKLEFDDFPLATFLVVGGIKSMERHTKFLLDCFTHKSPEEYYTPVRDINHKLGDAFSGVIFTYDI